MVCARVAFCALAAGLLAGCNSILNGWLTPIELGSYARESTLPIRGSLSIQDTPRDVRGATEPTPEDLVPTAEEYRLVPGDVVNVFIFELRQQGADSAAQAVVDNRGKINIPVLGWIDCAGLTAEELEVEFKRILAERDIIRDAQVLVQFAARRGLTYTIFGNETLAVRLNRGPGVFPVPRPDFRLLDALSVSGGLSELVREIFVFRKVERDRAQAEALRMRELAPSPNANPTPDQPEPDSEQKVPDAPPPLPSVLLSDERGASARFLGSARTPRNQDANQPPREDASDKPDAETGDVQEIIDLMLSKPQGDEQPPAEESPSPPDETSTEEPPVIERPVEAAPPPSEQDQAGAPSNWVFLNGEWIEVTPDSNERAVQETSGPSPEDGVMEPAVDWDELAEGHRDIRIIRISVDGLRQGDSRYNIVVRAGDVIRLFSGDIGFYYMTGHVRRPGVYTFRSGATITLKNAVAAAAGLDALGWPEHVTVYRRIGEQEQMIQVNLDRIYAGLDEDFYLKKDDIVNVGTHPVAPFLVQLRNFTVPQMGGSITYFYRFIRQEVFFKNENLNAPNNPGIFP